MNLRSFCLSLLLLAAPLQSQPAPAGPEINIATADSLSGTVLVSHPGGGFSVLWEANANLFAHRFDAQGRSLTGDVPLGRSCGFDAAAVGSGFVVAGLCEDYPRKLGRIFDADGRPLGEPFPIDPAEAPALSAPRLAAAPGGGFSAVWTGQNPETGRRTVYLRRFDPTGVPLGPVARLTGPAQDRDAYDAGAVQSLDGRLLVLWFGFSPWYASGQIFGPSGETLAGPFPLGAGDVLQLPAAAFRPDGGFLVAWRGNLPDPSGSGTQVSGDFGRLYDPAGSPRGEAFPLEPGIVSAPVLGSDGQGRLFAAWFGDSGLRVVEIGADGSPGRILVRPSRLGLQTPVALAAWGDGKLAVAWGQYDRGTRITVGLGVQRFATGSPGVLRFAAALRAGPEGSGPFTVSIERREGSQGAVSVRYTLRSGVARAGEDFLPFSGTVTFADGDSDPKTLTVPVLDDALPEGDEPLVLTLSDPSGGAVLAAPYRARIEIRDDDTPCPLRAKAPFDVETGSYFPYDRMARPSVAVLAGGGMVAAWERWYDRFQVLPVHGTRVYDRAGLVVASSVWFTDGADAIQFAAHPGGGFTMTAMAYTLQPYSILGTFGQRFDSRGRPVIKPYPLAGTPWALAAGKAGRLFALAGRDGTLSFFRYGPWGQPLGSPLPVTAQWGSAALASDRQGRAVAAWTEGPPGARRVFVRRVSADGRWLGGAFEADPLLERWPEGVSVAAAPDGRFAVVWEANGDGSGSGIFGRRFAANGQPLGPVFQVNSQTVGDQTSPRVAVQGDGRFLVVWKSPHEYGIPRIHGQYYSAGGSRLGSEMLVADDDPNRSEDEPALASDAAGHYAVVWRRQADPDAISCRLFTAP